MNERYEVDLGTILDEHGAQIDVEDRLALDIIVVGDEEFRPIGDADFKVALINSGSGIVAAGFISAQFTATCSRCLEEFTLPIKGEVEGFYIEHGAQAGLPEEQEYEFIEERKVDLAPALSAALVVDLPFAPLHDPDCAGICPSCGANRNVSPCECEPETASSPFAALKDMFPSDESE